MPINPNIALSVQAPKFNVPDPEAEYGKALQLKSLMLQQQDAEQARADERAQRQAFAASGGDESAYLKALMQGGNVKAYQAAQKFIDDRKKAEAERLRMTAQTGKDNATAAKTLTENDVLRLTQHNNLLAGVQTPEQADAWITLGVNNGAIKPESVPLLRQTFGNAQTPDAFRDAINRLSLGMKEYIEKNKPTIQTRNTGGTTDTISVPGLGGPASIINSVQNTQSPDNAATNARMAAEARANREQAERHFGETKALQRERLDWEKSQEKSKLPASTQKEIASIDAQISVLDGALRDVAATPGAFTFKRGLATMAGAVPESLAGRLDSPGERDARSYVFNVVSKVINERAGAAQSAQELARLRSFLPAETDNAEQITDKLNSFKGYLADLGNGYQPGRYQPQAPKPPKPSALSPEDQQARDWALKNPNDPRAKQIMQRLGG